MEGLVWKGRTGDKRFVVGRGGYEGEEGVDGTWIEEVRKYALIKSNSSIHARNTGEVLNLLGAATGHALRSSNE